MVQIVYPDGEQVVTLAVNDKLAVSSYDVTQISQLIRNPNQPDAWSLLYTTQPGAGYTTDAFASGAVLKISAFAAPVLYDVGPTATIPTVDALADEINTINDEIDTINDEINIINLSTHSEISLTDVSGSWALYNQLGSSINIVSSTTSGFQEAFTLANPSVGTAGYDLHALGGNISAGGPVVSTLTTTLTIPAAEGKKTRVGSIKLNSTAALSGSTGLIIDSQRNHDLDFAGTAIAYAGSGQPISFTASTATPVSGDKTFFGSSFKFTSTTPVAFNFPVGSTGATNNIFDFGILNVAGASTSNNATFYVPDMLTSQNFTENRFYSQCILTPSGKTAWKVGSSGPAGGQIMGRNFYTLNLVGSSGYNGIDTVEIGSFYLTTISDVGAGTPINFRSGSANNVIIAPYYDTSTNDITDSGSGNIVIGNGKIRLGTGASLQLGQVKPFIATAPTITSGFGTSPSIIASNTAAFKVTVGSAPGSTGVIALPTAANGWVVNATNVTSNASLTVSMSSMSTTSVTLTSYSRTTGLATDFNEGDVIAITATAF